jgi:hypothetical protein
VQGGREEGQGKGWATGHLRIPREGHFIQGIIQLDYYFILGFSVTSLQISDITVIRRNLGLGSLNGGFLMRSLQIATKC